MCLSCKIESESEVHPAHDGGILILGDIARWKARGGLPDETRYYFLDLPELCACTIGRYSPALVLSPLVADGFDAMDVAERLHAASFAGRYRVVAEALPDPDLIRREIRAVAPALDFDLLVLHPGRQATD